MRGESNWTGLSALMLLGAVGCGEATSTPSSSGRQEATVPREERRAGVTHIRQPDEPAVQRTVERVATSLTNTAAQTPATTAPTTLGTGAIRFDRIVIAEGIENRAPVGAATSFARGAHERLYVYLEGINTSGAPAELTVSFSREGSDMEVGGVRVNLPTTTERRAWRTWAFTRQTSREGTWTAHVRTADGTEVGATTFTITG